MTMTMSQEKKTSPCEREPDVLGAVNDAAEFQLPAEAQARIGRKLREAYEEVLAEPLPDRFSSLLDELARTEPRKAKAEPQG